MSSSFLIHSASHHTFTSPNESEPSSSEVMVIGTCRSSSGSGGDRSCAFRATLCPSAIFVVLDGSGECDDARTQELAALIETPRWRSSLACMLSAPPFEHKRATQDNVLLEASHGRYGEFVEFKQARVYTESFVRGVRLVMRHLKTLDAIERLLSEKFGSALATYDAKRNVDDMITSFFRLSGTRPFAWCRVAVDECVPATQRRTLPSRIKLEAWLPDVTALSPWPEDVPAPPQPPFRVLYFDFETLNKSTAFAPTDLLFLCNAQMTEYFGAQGKPTLVWNRSRILVPSKDSMIDEKYSLHSDGSWPSDFALFDSGVERDFEVSAKDAAPGGVFEKHELIHHETSASLLEGIAFDFRQADAISGHNIGGFDLDAFVRRVKHVIGERAPELSLGVGRGDVLRLHEASTTTKNKGWMKKTQVYGLTGMHVIDTLTVFRSLRPPDVTSFSLEGLAKHTLKSDDVGKDPVPYHQLASLYRHPRGRHIIVRYCAKDTMLCRICAVKKMFVEDIFAKCTLSRITVSTCINKGSTSKIVGPLAALASERRILFRSEPYGSSSSSGPSHVSKRDSDDSDSDASDSDASDGEVDGHFEAQTNDEEKSGGFVCQPNAGVYKDAIGIHDFAALYPNIIIAVNICPSTIGSWKHFRSMGKPLASFDEEGKPVPGGVVPIVRYHKRKRVRHPLMPKAPLVEPPLPRGRSLDDPSFYELVHESKLEGVAGYSVYREVVRDHTQCVVVPDPADENTQGICPVFARQTLDLRKQYKTTMKIAQKKLDTATDLTPEERRDLETQIAAADSAQKSAKELCNSLFGVFGARGGPLFNQAVASVIPKVGCMLNLLYSLEATDSPHWPSRIRNLCLPESDPARQPNVSLPRTGGPRMFEDSSIVERFRGFEIVYGDSVTARTPVLVRVYGHVCLRTIDSVAWGNRWYCDRSGNGKQYAELPDVDVYTERGWVKATRLIRHACRKPIVRVATQRGIVECTTDHSLVAASGEPLKATKAAVGTRLLTTDVARAFKRDHRRIDCTVAKFLGFFLGCGHAQSSLDMHVHSETAAIQYQTVARIAGATGISQVVYNANDDCYSFSVYAPASFVRSIAILAYDRTTKRIPEEIMQSDYSIQEAFLAGRMDAHWANGHSTQAICASSMLEAGAMYILLSGMGYSVTLRPPSSSDSVYRVAFSIGDSRDDPRNAIESIELVHEANDDDDGDGIFEGVGRFVYDFTVEPVHHFCAGAGNLVVHNTDSVMVLARGERLTQEEHCLLHHCLCDHYNKHTMFDISKYRPHEALEMELEALYAPIIFFPKKKSYVYRETSMTTLKVGSQTKYKGVTAIKKNTEQFNKDLQKALYEAVLMAESERDMQHKAVDVVLRFLFMLNENLVPSSHFFKTCMLSRDPGKLQAFLQLPLDASRESVQAALRSEAYTSEIPALRIIRRAELGGRPIQWTDRFAYLIPNSFKAGDRVVDELCQNVELLHNPKLRPSVQYYALSVVKKVAAQILAVAGLGEHELHAAFYTSQPRVQAPKRGRSAEEQGAAIRALRASITSGIAFAPKKEGPHRDAWLCKAIAASIKKANAAVRSAIEFYLESKQDTHGWVWTGASFDQTRTFPSIGEVIDQLDADEARGDAKQEQEGHKKVTYPKKGFERWPMDTTRGLEETTACAGGNGLIDSVAIRSAYTSVKDIEESHLTKLKDAYHQECMRCKRNSAASTSLDEDSIKEAVDACKNEQCTTLYDRQFVAGRLKELAIKAADRIDH